ncbi:hypothetical protein EBZ39_02135 [bacterium]|nr:hypothetical protein [bacterium]
MSWVAVAIGGSALLGYMGSQRQAGAAESAAAGQVQAASDAARQQREMFDILNAQQAPYRQAGYGALTNIQQMLPQFTKTFTPADLQTNLAPNYEFIRQQGLGAVSQNMNVGSPGSNVDLARQKFATGLAQGAYQDALSNWRNQQTDIYNRLSNLAGIGQTSQGQAQTLGQTTAANIGQLGIGGATAAGAGQIGAANAMAGGLSNIGNAATLASLIRPAGVNLGPSSYTGDVSGSNFMNAYNAIGRPNG